MIEEIKDKKINTQTIQTKILKIIDKKTISVDFISLKKHVKYGKYLKVHKKYLVHCEDSTGLNKNDVVLIKDCRPYSKLKTKILVGKI